MDREQSRRELLDFMKTLQPPDADVVEPGDDDRLLGQNLADSLDLLNMITFLEDRYGIDFEKHAVDPDEFNTLGGILNIIERHAPS